MASHRLQLKHQAGTENPGWFWRVVADDADPADDAEGRGPYADREQAVRSGQEVLDEILAEHAATPDPEAVWHDFEPPSDDAPENQGDVS